MVLARNGAIPFLRGIMVAPVTTVIRGLPSEVPLGKDFGLEAPVAVNLDAVMTVSRFRLGESGGAPRRGGVEQGLRCAPGGGWLRRGGLRGRMGILKGRRGPALPAVAFGTLGDRRAVPGSPHRRRRSPRFTHGECLASDTRWAAPGEQAANLQARTTDHPDDDARFFGLQSAPGPYVARSSRFEQGGGQGPNLFSMTLSVHCKESVAIGGGPWDATATVAGQDYTEVDDATRLCFRPGSNGAQCGVDTMDDETPEPDETFMVESFQLTDPNICDGTTLCAAGDPEPAHLCVLDDDPGGGQPNPLCDFGQRPARRVPESAHPVGDRFEPMALTVTEGDTAGDTYTVVLKTLPTGSVTVTIGGHSGTHVRVDPDPDPPSLTFTTQELGWPQTVKVTAVHDATRKTTR